MALWFKNNTGDVGQSWMKRKLDQNLPTTSITTQQALKQAYINLEHILLFFVLYILPVTISNHQVHPLLINQVPGINYETNYETVTLTTKYYQHG